MRRVVSASLLLVFATACGRDGAPPGRVEVGVEAPMYAARTLTGDSISLALLRGKPVLLNVWATWCLPCREEHPVLLELSRSGAVPIYGMDYKDQREDALSLLSESGNPYVQCTSDADGRVAIDYGVYGVPETYLIDREGVIRYIHPGGAYFPGEPGYAALEAAVEKALR